MPVPESERDLLTSHFEGRAPNVQATYDALLALARTFGEVREEPKKTSIHLVRRTAFATRKDALILTIKADTDLASPRIAKREQTSRSRWHHEVRLASPGEVDAEIRGWLARAYEILG
jgi:hypothetical protein